MARPAEFRTAWARTVDTPLRAFLRTEASSAAVLLVAAVAALVWVNLDAASYVGLWRSDLSVRLGAFELSATLREWVNSGLMTFFFFVVGLEARREFDMGELRERRRVTLPVLAGLGGMALPVLIYLAINAGHASAQGWGAAMSTDTAFALGILALVGPHFPDRLRVFMLTIVVIDDLIALAVIAFVYSERVSFTPLLVALGFLGAVLILRAAGVRRGLAYLVLGVGAWVAMFSSGVDPVVVGVVMGLLTYAYPAARGDLERASDLFRQFREQPTPELARNARQSVESSISPNERLQLLYHPWTSYVIVPVFALANIGIVINGAFLARAFTSPITLGILIGYVVGKPAGILAVSALVTKLSRGRLRPPVGWAAVGGAGTLAGIGFTVGLLIATLAFSGTELEEAKLGILSAAVGASVITWVLFRVTALLPKPLRVAALFGRSENVVDLAVPVDPDRDHIRGAHDSPITLLEYGDLECPYCHQAEAVIREVLRESDVRYVWRHLPLVDVHPHAQMAAEASEAAAAQGMFWEMHDALFEHQDDLTPPALVRTARTLGLDVERFRKDLHRRNRAGRVAEDVDSADLSNVSGTPTFFVNGQRHQGEFDIESLSTAVRLARARLVTRNR
ncbi:MAG: Na+/H+ antiporter NhaA [Mycobacteriales bacterium]